MTAKTVAGNERTSFCRMVADLLKSHQGSIEWVENAAEYHELQAERRNPAVLVISPDLSDHDAIRLAEQISGSSPETAILLARQHEMNGTLPAAMRAGVRDVVDLSRGEDLEAALKRALAWSSSLAARRGTSVTKGTIISIFSSKGGTGKTMLSTNLAAAIAQRSGQATAILDLDLGMGDVFTYFGAEPARTLRDLLSIAETPDEATVRTMATEVADNLFAFGSPPDPAAERVPGDQVVGLMRSLQAHFPFVIVDLGPNYSDHTLASFDISDVICLIGALDVVAIKHLAKSMETLLSIGVPRDRLRLALNRTGSKVGLESIDVETVLKITADARIPSSRVVPASLNKGRPAYLAEPKSEVARSIGAFADQMIALRPQDHDETSGRRRLFRR